MRFRVWFCVSLILATALAFGHDLNLSGVRLIFRSNDLLVSVMIPRSKLIQSGGLSSKPSKLDLQRAVESRLDLWLDGSRFQPAQSSLLDDPANDVLVWQANIPKKPARFELKQRLFPEDPASRTLVAVLRDGLVAQEATLDRDHLAWSNRLTLSSGEIALRFLKLGVEHILSGADHILFVLGLILLGGGAKALLKTVTAFTLAHSVTLSLAATGVWSPSPRIVEPLIALSIVAIAVENLRAKPSSGRDYRPLVAFLFGLVHGFGFAGALSEVGLHGQALALALVCFNLGVEAGQASIIVLAAPVLGMLEKWKPVALRRLALGGSVAIGAIGIYWFAARLMGGS